MTRKIYTLFVILIGGILILSGCTDNEKKSDNGQQLVVYTTVYPLFDFAEKIGGEFVRVETVYPPGADEHTFEPSQRDMISMAEADLFFYIGYGLEGFVDKTKTILEDEGVKVVPVGEAVKLEEKTVSEQGNDNHGHSEDEIEHSEHEHSEDEHDDEQIDTDGHDHNHGSVNPHLWLDPIYAKQMAQVILEQLVEAMPEQKQYFENNFSKIESNFDEIDNQFSAMAKEAKHHTFIVSHAAYSYWEERYGIEELSISGMSTSQEPSQRELTAIIDKVKEKNLKYILIEQNVNSKLAEVIQKEAKLEKLMIHNLSVLTNEDLNNGKDYFSIMQENIDILTKALNE